MSGVDAPHPETRGISRPLQRWRLWRLWRERRQRGTKEYRRLQRADAVLYSPGNSGRTWMRALLTRALESHLSLPAGPLLSLDNLHKLNSGAPVICVTHNRWLPYYRPPEPSQRHQAYYDKPVLVLTRNPLDTCISQHFQWLHRSKDHNIALKGWPPRSSNMSLQEFLRHPLTGVEQLCAELNGWLEEAGCFKGIHFIRYEDMLESPAQSLEGALQFYGIDASQECIKSAVEACSFDSMRSQESETGSLVPGSSVASSGSDDALKMRRGGVGGYTRYLSETDASYFENLVARQLDPAFGYGSLPQVQPASLPGGPHP